MHKVNSIRLLWLACVTLRYGVDKVFYERQMALMELNLCIYLALYLKDRSHPLAHQH